MLKPGAAADDIQQFRAEIKLMEELPEHPHVLRPIGHCLEQEPLFLVVPYMSQGSLKDFLRSRRPSRLSQNTEPLTVGDLLNFSLQISKAMEFLAAEKVVHRDLATRNILVDENMICKVR